MTVGDGVELGQSPLAYAFEESVLRDFKSSTGTGNIKQIELRGLSMAKASTTNRFFSAENASQ